MNIKFNGLSPSYGMIKASGVILILCLIEALGLYYIKRGEKYDLIKASIIYACVVVPLLFYSLNFEGIGMVNFIWNVLSTIIVFMIGIYLFQEKIGNLQLIGVCISLLGTGLIILAPCN